MQKDPAKLTDPLEVQPHLDILITCRVSPSANLGAVEGELVQFVPGPLGRLSNLQL